MVGTNEPQPPSPQTVIDIRFSSSMLATGGLGAGRGEPDFMQKERGPGHDVPVSESEKSTLRLKQI